MKPQSSLDLSIILPILNEAPLIRPALRRLLPLRRQGVEVIVVDGGSQDGSSERVGPFAEQCMRSERGRSIQMNAGAQAARGRVLLFLHVDTLLPLDAKCQIQSALADNSRCWGRFDVRIEGKHPSLRVIAVMMNLRSRLTGIATGDQALFVTCEAFERVGGFPPQALMEDIALSRSLKRLSPPACLRATVVTSGRRWERHGVLRTITLMLWLRLTYFLGVSPQRLARWYGYRGEIKPR
ncbi:glycosyl transferase [Acidihalobacter yilgarnensis]|uniref:Glycosyl transferase n=1 Tax=Acidihalobacter yilgarnensis TaxID=2819280 RepID=A0A1D8INC8_9GAMM|nr:TIGR04283 family arsenosugar biosynthesis glycosyltransferase [Acidihalobacter yilgarnensis]AOU97978.1 glycosyl transferase [Acidihalobacter yilgarnensis]